MLGLAGKNRGWSTVILYSIQLAHGALGLEILPNLLTQQVLLLSNIIPH